MVDTIPAQITIYTLPGCPRCARARALLKRRGLRFQEVSGSGVPGFREEIAALTGGWTVPQIVIDEQPSAVPIGWSRLTGRGFSAQSSLTSRSRSIARSGE